MKLTIGILAYNEELSIGRTIHSITSQTLFQSPPVWLRSIELVCVPNGCKDDTVAVAQRAMNEMATRAWPIHVTFRVVEIKKGGKTNAWNECVHSIADQNADYLIMSDGDIRVEHPNTMVSMLATLHGAPSAFLSTPRAIKHIAFKERKSLRDRISLRLGELNRARPYGFAGCFYCARGPVLRRIWFPDGMIGEDAFLNGLILTDLCRSSEQYERVVHAPDASVVFEAYTSAPKVFRVLRRQAVTRGMNAMLWSFLWANVTAERDAGEIIRVRSRENPGWFRDLIRDEVQRRGRWVMPKGVVWRRVRYLRYLSGKRRLLAVPSTIVGVIVDVFVNVAANRRLRRLEIDGMWETTRTTQI
ncbi:MAG: glycosyltransferase family 2 protein [Phycisphaerales bacterium]|nr:glycosyltransferase family 2 protein [Phycisphaerales bacterium]